MMDFSSIIARDILRVAGAIVAALLFLGGAGFILFHFITKYW